MVAARRVPSRRVVVTGAIGVARVGDDSHDDGDAGGRRDPSEPQIVWGSTDPAGNGEQKKRRTASDA